MRSPKDRYGGDITDDPVAMAFVDGLIDRGYTVRDVAKAIEEARVRKAAEKRHA